MDSSLLTQRRRLAAGALSHHLDQLHPRLRASGGNTALVSADIRAGRGPFFYNGLQSPLPPSTATPTVPTDVMQTFLFSTMDSMFSFVAAGNYGPTRTSRLMYIWSMSIATVYNWVTRTSPYIASTDGWVWTTTYPLPNEDFVSVFMTQALTVIMPTIIAGYDPIPLLTQEQAAHGWTNFEYTTQINYVRTAGHFDEWYAAWHTWYLARSNDGSVAASVPPNDTLLPNRENRLNPAVCQDITAYPSQNQWTPLIFGTSTKNYLTRLWEQVTPVGLSSTELMNLKTASITYFPSTEQERNTELADVVAKTTSLGIPGVDSDAHKIQAEFWAGGPFTISPPGMFMWILKQYFTANTVYDHKTFVYSALDLAIQLFEVGRVVWGIKLQYQQARPIQDIRRIYATQRLGSWNTTRDLSGNLLPAADISGCLWMPYQVLNFVTPPFPDYVSGHSSYSKIFALVMTDWFGPTIPRTAPVLMTNLNKFSAMFSPTDTQPFGTFVVPAGRSEIQPGLVPAAPVTITFSTWEDMAESAGISRQWGGIHAESAHVGGVVTATSVHTILRSKSTAISTRKST